MVRAGKERAGPEQNFFAVLKKQVDDLTKRVDMLEAAAKAKAS